MFNFCLELVLYLLNISNCFFTALEIFIALQSCNLNFDDLKKKKKPQKKSSKGINLVRHERYKPDEFIGVFKLYLSFM